jgi:hypothetical protein
MGKMQLVGVHLHWLLVVPLLVCTACSGTPATGQRVHDDDDDAGTGDSMAPDAGAETGCGETPARLVSGRNFFTTTDAGGLNLRRIPAAGGRAVIIQGGGLISSLALDDACLYWSQASGIYAWARSAADEAPEMGLRSVRQGTVLQPSPRPH